MGILKAMLVFLRAMLIPKVHMAWGQESSPHWKALFSLAFNSPSRSHFGRLTTRFVSPMLIALWRHSIEDTS